MKERRFNLRVSSKLYKDVKVKCVREDKTLSDVVRDLLALWVNGDVELPKPTTPSKP